MKKIMALAAALAFLGGCTERTEFGPCIGAFDEKDPALRYKVEGWNIAMGVIFFELIAPPIIVVTDETFCPVGRRQ